MGGTDFDQKLQDLVIKKFKDDKNKKISRKDFTGNDAEELKISLSKREEALARAKNTNIKISRKEFEDEISSYIAQTEMTCETVIEKSKLKASEISKFKYKNFTPRI